MSTSLVYPLSGTSDLQEKIGRMKGPVCDDMSEDPELHGGCTGT